MVRWRALFLLAAGVAVCGCVGSDEGPDPFRLCGNGALDRGEECDDGNQEDVDDCLATCQRNRCGDEFLNRLGPQNAEVCDGRQLNNQTCVTLGFQGGTLGCASDCAGYDTSMCTPRPTPTPRSVLAAVTPTATATVPALEGRFNESGQRGPGLP